MYTRVIFEGYTGSNNSKVKGVVLILKLLGESVRYLDVFCYKAIVMFISTNIRVKYKSMNV